MTSCDCGARIFFARTPAGKLMPLDAEAAPDGTVGLDQQRRAIVNPIEDDRCGPERYRPHWSTCPNADRHRKPRGKR